MNGKPLFPISYYSSLIVTDVFPLYLPSPKQRSLIQSGLIYIEIHCQTIDENTTAEIVICVFPSLYGHGIKDSSGNEINDITKLGVYIFNDEELEVYDGTQRGIGKQGKDNGVLLVIALQEREYRFEVGYGLEGDITDIETNLIAQTIPYSSLQRRRTTGRAYTIRSWLWATKSPQLTNRCRSGVTITMKVTPSQHSRSLRCHFGS